jgi:hypothetical protein
MSTFNPRRFVNVEILRQVDQDSLIQFLRKYEGYLKERGFSFEKNAEGELEFDNLVAILLDPTEDVDDEFIDKLCLLHDVADEKRFDDLCSEAENIGLTIDHNASPADVALQIMLHDQNRLWRLHSEIQILKPKTFIHYVSDEDPPEDFPVPTQAELDVMAAAMDPWFEEKKRGRGCRVYAVKDDHEEKIHFLIRHGMQFKREGSVENGKSSSVFYRPENHDVVTYDRRNNHLSVFNKSQARSEREMYVRVFGATFFSNVAEFYQDKLFTLDPLREKGRKSLVCSDIEGIEEVKLVELRVQYKSPFNDVRVWRSTDLFASLAAANEDFPMQGDIQFAKFEFKISGAQRKLTAVIMPPGKTRYDRNQDAHLIEKWLARRGFMIVDEAATVRSIAA